MTVLTFARCSVIPDLRSEQESGRLTGELC